MYVKRDGYEFVVKPVSASLQPHAVGITIYNLKNSAQNCKKITNLKLAPSLLCL